MPSAQDIIAQMLADSVPKVAPPKNDTARSRRAADVAPDPAASQDIYGPRSAFLQRMDKRSEIPVVKGPMALLVDNKPQLRAGKLVDAINAARAKSKEPSGD